MKRTKKIIEEIFNGEVLKGLVDDFNKQAKNKNQLLLRFDNKKKRIYWEDLTKSINCNDVIEFEDQGILRKAVVTAKGKTGITARDREQRQIKLEYKNIINYYKRKK